MKYRIVVLPSAKADIKEAARWMRQYSREKAQVWVDGIYEAINSLDTFPARCALIPQARCIQRRNTATALREGAGSLPCHLHHSR